MVLEHLGERRRRYRSPTPHPEHERIAFAERARRVENHQRPRAQQNRVLALGLHRHGRRSPHAVGRAGLGPGRESDFRRPATVSTRISNAALMRPVPDPDARSVSMAAGTPSWGQRQLVRHDVVLRTEQRSTRSQELSFRSRFIAMAHRSRARMRWCTALAVSAFTCQVGIWIPSISAVLTSETSRRPIRGKDSVRGGDPVLRIPPVARAPTLLFEHALAVLGDSRNARRATLLRRRVATGLGQLLVGEACSRAAASETSPAAPTDGIERGRSARTAPSGCATGPRARDAKSTTGTKTTRTRRARGARRTTGRQRKEGVRRETREYEVQVEITSKSGSSRLGAMPPMRS